MWGLWGVGVAEWGALQSGGYCRVQGVAECKALLSAGRCFVWESRTGCVWVGMYIGFIFFRGLKFSVSAFAFYANLIMEFCYGQIGDPRILRMVLKDAYLCGLLPL